MKEVFLWIAGLIVVIILVLALDYGLGLKWFAFIEPQKENVRREIFLNTRSYNEGKMQDLIKYRLEYLSSKDNSEKQAIAETIRMSFAEFDENKLPLELKTFLKQIKYGDLQ